jgi:hypothetical protein
MAGTYQAMVLVPEGGIAAVELGLQGTTDLYFPVSIPTTARGQPRMRTESPTEFVIIGVAIALAGVAAILIARRRVATELLAR